MDDRTLEQTLGFTITHGHMYVGGKFKRVATHAEMKLWQLLLTPQSDWVDFSPDFTRGTIT